MEADDNVKVNQKKDYPFLSQWRIKNFKSIHEANIDLAPLTVLVGPNSAGKSSLLQSILLFAQNSRRTMREFDSNARGGMILNGDLVKLGTIEESRSDLEISAGKSIVLGATFLGGVKKTSLTRRNRLRAGEGSLNEQLSFDVELINEPGTENTGTAIVGEAKVKLATLGGMSEFLNIEFSNGTHLPLNTGMDNRAFSTSYKGTIEKFQRGFSLPGEESKKSITKSNFQAFSFSAGLPSSGAQYLTKLERLLNEQARSFSTQGFFINDLLVKRLDAQDSELMDFESAINVSLILINESLQRSENSSSKNSNRRNSIFGVVEPLVPLHLIKWPSLEEVLKNSPKIWAVKKKFDSQQSNMEKDFEKNLKSRGTAGKIPNKKFSTKEGFLTSGPSHPAEMSELEDMINELATDELDAAIDRDMSYFVSELAGRANDMFSNIEDNQAKTWDSDREERTQTLFSDFFSFEAVQNWNSHLSTGVLYLEPLREAPKPYYSFESGGSISPQIPLGSKGEHLGQRLYDRRPLVCPLPGNLMNTTLKMPLIDVVNAWLEELNIEGPIKVESQGRAGFLLTVGGRVLPMLGTGISQVLPVLTLCLIARRGDLILLEQPELHLNPSMQQLLADFLLKMSETGRQIIVETHSEYLVTRLRLKSLEEENYAKALSILFVEKDPVFGTEYRKISTNKYGEIENWPKGFFDQASSDYKKLILKIAEKKEADRI